LSPNITVGVARPKRIAAMPAAKAPMIAIVRLASGRWLNEQAWLA
jgi:hypothetical protein